MTTANFYIQGQKAFLGGNLEESIKAFSAALEEGLQPFSSRLNRGIAYLKTGRFTLAIDDFNTIIAEDGEHEPAFFYRGIANLNLEENEKAVHDLDRALALNPERADAHLARGLAHYFLEHSGDADKDVHNSHVLRNVEPGEFMEEYIFSDSLFKKTSHFFENYGGEWTLALTDNEIQRMAAPH